MISPQKRFPWLSVASLATAVLGNIVAALLPVSTLLQMPPGSSGRLMADAAFAFLVAAATLVLVLAVTFGDYCRSTMAKFLISTMPATGHVNPMLPVAVALVGRGHDVW